MIVSLLFLFCVTVNSAPIEENLKENDVLENEMKDATSENVDEKSRAGIIDTLNPFNNKENSEQPPNINKDNEQNSNLLAPIQNFFNGSNNPFGQLFSSQPGSNMLDNIKIFMVGSQGMVMPASAALGGFQNFMQALGNMGNFVQGAQNLLPTGT